MSTLDSLPLTIFRPFEPNAGRSDRSAGDRALHRNKIKGAIKDNLPGIISDESIIGQSGDKVIKVPIKGIREYRFIYGDNPQVGTGDGSAQPGQKVGKAGGQPQQGQGKGKAGDEAGEDVYETEITLAELTELLFEELKLPNLKKTSVKEIIAKSKLKKDGYRRVGIQVRLDRRKTAKQRVMRKMATQRHHPLPIEECPECGGHGGWEDPDQAGIITICNKCEATGQVEQRFRFRKEDRRYRHMEVDPKPQSNAAILCVMDTSGSMDTNKKFLAKSFFYLMYLFIKAKYDRSEIVFVAYHTEANEVTEDEFFHKGESGGTYVSSGLNKAIEIIKNRYNPSIWNNYVFNLSDGDNVDSDNPAAFKAYQDLCELCSLVGYGEIKPNGTSYYESSMLNLVKGIKAKNISSTRIENKDQIWPALKALLDIPDQGE